MRFDTPVFFQQITPGPYDYTTGNYGPDTVIEDKRMADITNTGAETLQIAYGELRQGSFTVRIQGHYTEPFSRIRIGEKVYRVDMRRTLRGKESFVVSEVQGNAKNQS